MSRFEGVARPVRVLVVVVALVLAGCTGGGAGSAGPDRAGGGGAAPAGRAGGRVGGTLPVALLDPGPLDPARAAGLEDEVVLGNLFDGLTALDPSGAVRPAVAASWTSDPGLRRWEFRLRPDARWSDGSPLTAADFAFAWQRLADPRAKPGPSPARTLLEPVAGYRAYAAGRARSITGLQAPDPTVLRVELARPFADLPALVASLPLSPLPRAAVSGDGAAYLAKPVGNGPFRLATRVRPGHPLVLERNPAHWDRPALLDRVSVHPVPDQQTAWLELQHGQVVFAPVPRDQLPAARTVHGLSADGRTAPGLLTGPTLTTWQLSFNPRARPAGDPRWRRAFSLAVDRHRLATALAASPAATLVPPALPGSGAASAPPACPACTHDPARARSLLARLDPRPVRTPVTLAVPPDPDARRIAALLAEDLAAAGLRLKLDPTPTPDAPVALVRRVAPYPRPAASLSTPSGYGPTVDRLLDQAAATPDDPARTRLYHQAEQAILTDLRVAPLLVEHHAAVLTPGVEGFNLTPWGTLDLATVSLPA